MEKEAKRNRDEENQVVKAEREREKVRMGDTDRSADGERACEEKKNEGERSKEN